MRTMFSINYIKIFFGLLILAIVVYSLFINCFEKRLPVFFSELFRYGKFSYKGKSSSIKPLKVPKSWFRHFYILSSILSIVILYLVVSAYLFGVIPPQWILLVLDFTCGAYRVPTSR